MVAKTKSISLENAEALLSFLPVFEDPDFYVGEVVVEKGVMPYWEYDRQVHLFIKTLYENGWVIDFGWPDWQKQAKLYWNNPAMLKGARISTIQKLLTTHVRKDRFCDGHLGIAIRSDHIVSILKRIKQLVEIKKM